MQKNQDSELISLNKEAYNRVADVFSSTRAYLWDDFKALGHYAPLGGSVLDIGCGNGRLYELFCDTAGETCVKYVGMDQSESLIAIATKTYPAGTFVVADMTKKFPFEDALFDAIYCMAAFCHIPPVLQHQTLDEMHRVLRPGGHVVMSNWNAYNTWVQTKVMQKKYTTDDQKNFFVPWRNGAGDMLANRYYYGFTLEELSSLAQDAQFTVCDQYFLKKGQHVDISLGENIISIFKKEL